MNLLIRPEVPADIPAIRKLVEGAFGQPAEARLVDQLRGDGDAVISAVAIDAGNIVGHILFSKMATPFRALGLAPVAVAPDRQGKRIGSRIDPLGVGASEARWLGRCFRSR